MEGDGAMDADVVGVEGASDQQLAQLRDGTARVLEVFREVFGTDAVCAVTCLTLVAADFAKSSTRPHAFVSAFHQGLVRVLEQRRVTMGGRFRVVAEPPQDAPAPHENGAGPVPGFGLPLPPGIDPKAFRRIATLVGRFARGVVQQEGNGHAEGLVLSSLMLAQAIEISRHLTSPKVTAEVLRSAASQVEAPMPGIADMEVAGRA